MSELADAVAAATADGRLVTWPLFVWDAAPRTLAELVTARSRMPERPVVVSLPDDMRLTEAGLILAFDALIGPFPTEPAETVAAGLVLVLYSAGQTVLVARCQFDPPLTFAPGAPVRREKFTLTISSRT